MPALSDRIAVITGSSRGIGAAIATLFAAEGARVVVHGRDRDALEAESDRYGPAATRAQAQVDALRGQT